MPVIQENLWSLATAGQPIDASALAAALENEAGEPELDFRTRLLIRDSLNALAGHWGDERLEKWLRACQAGDLLRRVWRADLGPAGFPSLTHRIMDAIQPDVVVRFLRHLGSRLATPAKIEIGGAISLILAGLLSRYTEDIDVADELPLDVRSQHDLLEDLAKQYGLHLAHFQSHYLATGWRDRLRSFGRFDQLDVLLVDPIDVFVGKLFSARAKDQDDLRALSYRLDKSQIESRLRTTAGALLADEQLAKQAAQNWYILHGEPLPV